MNARLVLIITFLFLFWLFPAAGSACRVFVKVKKPTSTVHTNNKSKKHKGETFFTPPKNNRDLARYLQRTHGNAATAAFFQKNLAEIPATHAQALLKQIRSEPKRQFVDWYRGQHKNNEPTRPPEAVKQLFELQQAHLASLGNRVDTTVPLFLQTQLLSSHPIDETIPTQLKDAERWARRVFGFQRDPTNEEVLATYKDQVGNFDSSKNSRVTYAAYLLLKTDSHHVGRSRRSKPDKKPGKGDKDQTGQTGKDQTGKDQTGKKDQTGQQQRDRSNVSPFLRTYFQQPTTQDAFFPGDRSVKPFFRPLRQTQRRQEDEAPIPPFDLQQAEE